MYLTAFTINERKEGGKVGKRASATFVATIYESIDIETAIRKAIAEWMDSAEGKAYMGDQVDITIDGALVAMPPFYLARHGIASIWKVPLIRAVVPNDGIDNPHSEHNQKRC